MKKTHKIRILEHWKGFPLELCIGAGVSRN